MRTDPSRSGQSRPGSPRPDQILLGPTEPALASPEPPSRERPRHGRARSHRPAAGAGSSRPGRAPSAALALAGAVLVGCAGGRDDDQRLTRGSFDYPATRTVDATESFHGVDVEDPYRWLEGDVRSDAEVAAWVRAQDAVARRYLARIDARDAIAERLEELWNYPKRSAPQRHGDWLYAWHNSGLEAQSRLVRARTAGELFEDAYAELEDFTNGNDDNATVGVDDGGRDDATTTLETVLDPNTLSEDGTVAYARGAYSDDGRWLAYGRAASGSDWTEWYVIDLETLEHTDDHLTGIKYGGVSWAKDGSGFYYARYDVPEDDKFTAQVTDQRVYFHRLGTPQSEDLFIHARPDEPQWSFSPLVTDDGRWLVLHVWSAGTDNQVHVFDLENATAEPKQLVDRFTASYWCVGVAPTGDLLFMTDQDAPNGRVLAVDPAEESPTWTEVVPEREWRLESVDEVGGRLAAAYLANASTQVVLYRFMGRLPEEVDVALVGATGAVPEADELELGSCEEAAVVDLPGIGTAEGFEGASDATDLFFSFASFATPPEVLRLDLETGTTTQVAPSALDLDASRYAVDQVWYESADGTRVPMFLCRRADLGPAADGPGEHPTLLYGYGGFDVSLTPYFSVTRLVWMEMGGVFAMPNLRGGGEFGEAWHRAGTRTNKQNVFDDFIAAGEWLVDNGWTRPDRLAIQGGSNGGLLVGACLIQRPDLFGACLPAVGVMDMLRFHQFTAGRYWVDDYGSVTDPDEFAALFAYSPYHNLEDGVAYPATLITTADTDDRVVPAHSFKFAARMQAAQGGDEPVLLRVESSAGHGAGKPTKKRIEEAADLWAFLVSELEFEPWE